MSEEMPKGVETDTGTIRETFIYGLQMVGFYEDPGRYPMIRDACTAAAEETFDKWLKERDKKVGFQATQSFIGWLENETDIYISKDDQREIDRILSYMAGGGRFDG